MQIERPDFGVTYDGIGSRTEKQLQVWTRQIEKRSGRLTIHLDIVILQIDHRALILVRLEDLLDLPVIDSVPEIPLRISRELADISIASEMSLDLHSA